MMHFTPTACLLIVAPALFVWPGYAQEASALDPSTPAEAIARAYSFEGWDEVAAISFTFNARLPNKSEPVQRVWRWDVVRDRATLFEDGEPAVTVMQPMRKLPDRAYEESKASHHFINDSYWLLFPFQLMWSDAKVEDLGDGVAPITDRKAQRVMVTYSADGGGYTPGDSYELFLRPDHTIAEWVFRRDGKGEGRPATWSSPVEVGPIKVSVEHMNGDGSFSLWFSDVTIEVKGQDKPVRPEPIEGQ